MIEPLSICLTILRGNKVLMSNSFSAKANFSWHAPPGYEFIDADGSKVGEVTVLIGHWDQIDSCPECEVVGGT
jgi:hypothetical protein